MLSITYVSSKCPLEVKYVKRTFRSYWINGRGYEMVIISLKSVCTDCNELFLSNVCYRIWSIILYEWTNERDKGKKYVLTSN